jgi:ferric-dicitrate binding protein FerR (iron transport regulator)
MSDDYLWDRSGPPDPDVERLESLLGRLRSTPPVPALPTNQSGRPALAGPAWTLRSVLPTLAAAASIALMLGLTWRSIGNTASWDVARLDGRPRIGSTALAGTGRIAVGQTLITDDNSRARVDVSTIGQVTIDPNSRMTLVETRDAHHQLALERGTLHATISAPPGQFIVDTPSARATDLGCAYTLHVDEDGSGIIGVTAGWVAFERDGVESFVPAGASCRTDPKRGLGTPRYDNESQAYRDALDEFDYGDPARQHEALQRVLQYGGNGDAITLWHLIPRVDPADRGAVVDALADQAPMPDGVTREAVMKADKAALDKWWDALGLGDTAWWRTWRRPMNSVMPGR